MVAASKFILFATASVAAFATTQAADQDVELNLDVETGHKLFEGDILAEFDQIAALYGLDKALELDAEGMIESHEGHNERRRLRVERGLSADEADAPYLQEAERLLGAPVTNNRLLWPQKTLYYIVNSPVSRSLIQRNLQVLNRATGIRFVEGTGNGAYVSVKRLSGCFSNVGRTGRAQDLSIGNGCTRDGTVQHEFMHALGLYHEQSNTNRDSFVRINFNNIRAGTENNFRTATSNDLGIPYDYGSVMHYSKTAFSTNGQNTISAIGGTAAQNLANENRMGQRGGIAQSDAIQLQLMYHCSSGARSIFDLCTPDCPCDEGQGDCDTDADCKGSLVCSQTDGPGTYDFLGQRVTITGLDVCVRGSSGPGPTTGPTQGQCADRNPSGLVYSNTGREAPCSELPSYCNLDIVQEACPATCGLCQNGEPFEFSPRQKPLGVENPVLVDPESYADTGVQGDATGAAGSVSTGTLGAAAAGAALFGGLVVGAGFVVYNRKNAETQQLTSAAGVDPFSSFRVDEGSPYEDNNAKV